MADPKQQALTRYLVLESHDEGRTWEYLGKQLAQSSEAALRAFFSTPPEDQSGLFVACSENAFKPRIVAAKVKTSISQAAMPDVRSLADKIDDGSLEPLSTAALPV